MSKQIPRNIRQRVALDGTVSWNAQIRRTGYSDKSKTFHTEQEAIDWLFDQERDIRERVSNPRAVASRHNVAGMVEAYLAEVKPTHKSYKDTSARCNYFAQRLAQVKLTELTPDMVQDAVGKLDCAPATRNRYLGSFSGCITTMSKVTNRRPALFIGPNPCKLVERATELGDGEATEVEIMSVTGHKTSASVHRYVKKTRQPG
jgi:hypothetical protein